MKCLLVLAILAMAGFSAIAQKKPTSLVIINALAVELPKPVVPQAAIAACATGQVKVKVLVDVAHGRVVSASAVSGHRLLRAGAIEAVRRAKFNPVNDLPIRRVAGYIVYNFPLPDGCPRPTEMIVLPICEVCGTRLIRIPKPRYPSYAAAENGSVRVEILVGKDGKVINAKAISGPTPLRHASEDAARQALFDPSYVNGQPVRGVIVYNFSL
jgi:TonB family protein